MSNDPGNLFIKQIEEILERYGVLREKAIQAGTGYSYEEKREIESLKTRAKAAIVRISGRESEYYRGIEESARLHPLDEDRKTNDLMSCLDALYQDLKTGYLRTHAELIHANVFADFLEMAEHLLEEGYKDPAAVIAGSTLEEHLRKLCLRHNVDIEIQTPKGDKKTKKASQMNEDLTGEDVYNKIVQKQITYWLGIRNSAAHGKYDEYTLKQVESLIPDIRDFIIKYPA